MSDSSRFAIGLRVFSLLLFGSSLHFSINSSGGALGNDNFSIHNENRMLQ